MIGAALSKDENLQRTIEIIMKHVDDVAKKQSTSKANHTRSDISDTSSNTLTKIDSNDPKGVIPMDNLSVEKVLSQLTILYP